MIEIEDLQKIIEIVEKHDISHFEFEQEDSRVVIEKQLLKPEFNNDNLFHGNEYEDTGGTWCY
ncbi:hypothetical protein CBU02nite_03610 [Clostridium butyricum]|uniref:Uncharacterized protein n=1 Tax=Clostridium butyricum TaxID=1492 RepID=A0A512TI27_CLOBU|nr:hypothetical protein [Clostridium butyricum]NOW22954.1 acetyl-CoA carboxylase biotin carboxyl carrier protein [Clostridium butyricum]GEQ19855.1 hypothetical protein CBU02nite_03610 [Clostridium butyricum]